MPKESPLIFVVDDEVLITETLAMILLANGYSALPFMDPLKALSYVNMRVPDLLLTDVRMPHMSGVELGIEVRKRCPACKVLLFSAHVTSGDLLNDKRIAREGFHLLEKPVPPKELLEKIDDLLT
jgi:CheY-like chemotaxis protein